MLKWCMNFFELLIFDLDGTLIDSRYDIAKAVNLTFRDLGLPEKPPEVIYGYVGDGVRRLIQRAVEDTDPALLKRSLQVFNGHYLSHLLDETRFYPNIEAMLNHFQEKKKAVVTNKPIHYTTKIMTGLNADRYFDLILGGEPVVNLKPHPEMILKTLEVLKVFPKNAVMIGDSVSDIHAARAAGVQVCAVGYGLGDVRGLRAALPDFFADTVSDLKGLFS